MSRPRTILLDLDGTLVDPAPGIIGSCRHAFEEMGFPIDPAADLHWMIGPPARQTFATLLKGRGDPEEALRRYRERYSARGLYEAAVYAGVPAALDALRAAGFDLLLCTAKATMFAARVVEHFGLRAHLSGLYGAELDGRFEDKGDLIAHILEAETLSPEDVCMVGDREHDILAAKRNGVASIGVLWGYGSEAELRQAGASLLVREALDLPAACEAVFRPG